MAVFDPCQHCDRMCLDIIIIITTLFQSQSNCYEGQQVHIIYTEPVLACRPEQPVTNNKV